MTDPYAASASVKLADPPPVVNEDPVHQMPTTNSGVPQGTSREILTWVNRDQARAELALVEEKKSEQPRKGLVRELKEILT